ncbi:MAG: hypothetical protein R3349_06515, partial [Geminicoccaceae bacterium]|nr:hypothetical protein [Geminicoccaceae bacterium]
MGANYPRDLIGYGARPPNPRWPSDARIALSFVLNFEEGGETSVLHGDPASEVYLHEVPGLEPRQGERDHVQRAIRAIEAATGSRPVGWYTGRVSLNTRRLVVEAGGFLYDSDSYADDLP